MRRFGYYLAALLPLWPILFLGLGPDVWSLDASLRAGVVAASLGTSVFVAFVVRKVISDQDEVQGLNALLAERVEERERAEADIRALNVELKERVLDRQKAEEEVRALNAQLQQRVTEKERSESDAKALNARLEKQMVERTLEIRAKNEQMQEDLRLARDVQKSFLPAECPCFPADATLKESALAFTHRYLPADAVGGDLFDVIRLSETEAGVLICDVMGHGVRAALVTAMMQAMVEHVGPAAKDPAQLLVRLNQGLMAVMRPSDSPMFVSACFLVVDLEAGEVRYATAGHPPPLLGRPGTGEVIPLKGAIGPALGLFDGSPYKSERRALEEGDLLLLYTDGLYEVESEAGEQFGHEQLRAALGKRLNESRETVVDGVVAEVREFAKAGAFVDDVCVVAVEVRTLEKRGQATFFPVPPEFDRVAKK